MTVGHVNQLLFVLIIKEAVFITACSRGKEIVQTYAELKNVGVFKDKI